MHPITVTAAASPDAIVAMPGQDLLHGVPAAFAGGRLPGVARVRGLGRADGATRGCRRWRDGRSARGPRAMAGGDRAGRAGGTGKHRQASRHCSSAQRIGRSPCTSAASPRPRGGAGCGGWHAPGSYGKSPCTRTRRRPGRRHPGRGGRLAWRPDATASKSPCTRTRPGGCRRHPGRAAQPRGAPAPEEPATAHAPGPRRVLPAMTCGAAERSTCQVSGRLHRALPVPMPCIGWHRALVSMVRMAGDGAGGVPSPGSLRDPTCYENRNPIL